MLCIIFHYIFLHYSLIERIFRFEKDIFLCTYIFLFLPEKQKWLFCGHLLKSTFFEFGNMVYGKGRFDMKYHDNTDLEIWHYDYENYLRIPEKPFHNIHVIEARYEAEKLYDHLQYTFTQGRRTRRCAPHGAYSDLPASKKQ